MSYSSPTDRISVQVPKLPVYEDKDSSDIDTQVSTCIRSQRRKKLPSEVSDAIKLRRQAPTERRRQLETAWLNWEKPVLKPGDFLVLLRPYARPSTELCTNANSEATLLTTVDKTSRLCIVHRFWSENEERSRHAFWVHGGIDIDGDSVSIRARDPTLRMFCSYPKQNSTQIFPDIRSLKLAELHPGKRGPQRYDSISSL